MDRLKRFKRVLEIISAIGSIAFVLCVMAMTGIMIYGIARLGPAVFRLM